MSPFKPFQRSSWSTDGVVTAPLFNLHLAASRVQIYNMPRRHLAVGCCASWFVIGAQAATVVRSGVLDADHRPRPSPLPGAGLLKTVIRHSPWFSTHRWRPSRPGRLYATNA